jgi:hypothetical protein
MEKNHPKEKISPKGKKFAPRKKFAQRKKSPKWRKFAKPGHTAAFPEGFSTYPLIRNHKFALPFNIFVKI